LQILQRDAAGRVVCGHCGAEPGVDFLGYGRQVAPGPKPEAPTRGVRQTQREGSEIAASSDEHGIVVKEGPPLVPEVKPTDREQVGSGW